MDTYSKSGLNWYRQDGVAAPSPVRKGNLSMLATAEFRDGQMVSTPINRQRYVWPNPYSQTRSGVLSRKLYMR